MAAPADMTTLDLTGKFVMNKTLSDDTSDVLTLQNIGWIARKGISLATITLHVKHYKDDAGVEQIDIDQTLTGGIKGTTEKRTLDWEERPHSDYMFGDVVGQSKRIPLSEVEVPFLKDGFKEEWCKEGVVVSYVVNSENDWTAYQVWGFEDLDGEKRYIRHLDFDCPKREKHLTKKLIYDYAGPLDA